MTQGSPDRHRFLSLGRSLALVFALLGITLSVLIAAQWIWVVEPRLTADAVSRSTALAQAQAETIAKILSRDQGESMLADLESAMDAMLLIKDPSTGTPFLLRIGLTLDYDHFPAARRSLDILRGVSDCRDCFVANIPLFQEATGALIGVARFDSSSRFLRDLISEVRGKLLWVGAAAFMLIALAWAGTNRLMRNLREAKDAADMASRAKSTFLATMSHEIRTPLNVILGMAHLLDRSGDLSDEQRRQVEAIRQSSDALFALVSDVLDFSQIESGRLELDRSEFDLGGLTRSTLAIFALRFEQKGLRLELQLDASTGRHYIGDANRIRQILINLLGNALKFTDKGWVRVETSVIAENDQTDVVRFRISDSGVGLSQDQLPTLFEGFSQSEGGVSRRFAGTGLGLAICRRLTQLMGGTIGAEGEPGKGSSFWVTLPLRRAQEHLKGAPDALSGESQPEPLRILVVDDDPLNRLFLKSLLEKWGHRVQVAGNGLEALRATDAERFDLIFLDLWMPEMNGFETARRIRMLSDPEISTAPIVALTADVTEEATAESRRSGINEVVVKPLNPERIRELLYAWRV